MKSIALALGSALLLAAALVDPTSAAIAGSPGSYRNPILHSDYSDPDVIRVDDSYYMVASTFHFSPGIPVLKSNDLLHWTLIGHVLPRLDFDPNYNLPGPVEFDDTPERIPFNTRMGHRYAAGVWAPSIRFHEGHFYVYFATPTEGVFMARAARAEGPWSAPVKVIDEPNLEDPCPLWDDDGNAYLVHSRVGAGPLVLRRMSADGTKALDAGKVIVEDKVQLPILEGPKLLKRDGYYYIFAPYGGVGEGPQAVLRSKNIYGPYDMRTVLSKGTTHVQAPHQGGYLETPSGEGWFLHFNSTGAYGRIVHLQPVRWEEGWPVMGELLEGAPNGQPVLSHRAPDVGGQFEPVQIQTSDEFSEARLGVQWEWNHNPSDANWSLNERRGHLRLKAMPAPNFVSARNTLTQVLHGRSSQITTRILVGKMRDGQKAGLAMFGKRPSWIGLTQQSGKRHLTFSYAGTDTIGDVVAADSLLLRVNVDDEFAPLLVQHRRRQDVQAVRHSRETDVQLVERRTASAVHVHFQPDGRRYRRLRLAACRGHEHRSAGTRDPAQSHADEHRSVIALHGRQRQHRFHRRHHWAADLPGTILVADAAADSSTVGLAQLSQPEAIHL